MLAKYLVLASGQTMEIKVEGKNFSLKLEASKTSAVDSLFKPNCCKGLVKVVLTGRGLAC